jgi:hypothetical protein
MAARYEYKVVQLRESLMGGKMSGDKLQKVLNEHAGQGWQLTKGDHFGGGERTARPRWCGGCPRDVRATTPVIPAPALQDVVSISSSTARPSPYTSGPGGITSAQTSQIAAYPSSTGHDRASLRW